MKIGPRGTQGLHPPAAPCFLFVDLHRTYAWAAGWTPCGCLSLPLPGGGLAGPRLSIPPSFPHCSFLLPSVSQLPLLPPSQAHYQVLLNILELPRLCLCLLGSFFLESSPSLVTSSYLVSMFKLNPAATNSPEGPRLWGPSPASRICK